MNEPIPEINCSTCRALCCRLEVRLIEDDDFKISSHFTEKTADLYAVMKRSEDGWCKALDRKTMRCTIYEKRPFICRDYKVGDYDCLIERKKADPTVVTPKLPHDL